MLCRRRLSTVPTRLINITVSILCVVYNSIHAVDAFLPYPQQFSLPFTSLYDTCFRCNEKKYKNRRYTAFSLSSSKKDISNNALPKIYSTNQFSHKDFSQVERIFAISDLHTDNIHNLSWLKDRCSDGASISDISTHTHENPYTNKTPGPKDILIVAGDISHDFSTLKKTLKILTSQLQCTVFFISGNHEAWIGGKYMDRMRVENSMQKLEMVDTLCQGLDLVEVEQQLVGGIHASPVWICPIQG